MPLHEVGAAHERSVLAGASVVMPEIEVDEVDRAGEWRTREDAVFAQAVDDGPSPRARVALVMPTTCSACVYTRSIMRRRVALQADLLHFRLGCGVVRTLVSDRVGEIVGEPL